MPKQGLTACEIIDAIERGDAVVAFTDPVAGRAEAAANIHIGIDWLSSVSFGHVDKIGRRVIDRKSVV